MGEILRKLQDAANKKTREERLKIAQENLEAEEQKKKFKQHVKNLEVLQEPAKAKEDRKNMLATKLGQYIWDTEKNELMQVYGVAGKLVTSTDDEGNTRKFVYKFTVQKLGSTEKKTASDDVAGTQNGGKTEPTEEEWRKEWVYVTKEMAANLACDHSTEKWTLGAPEDEKGDITKFNAHMGRHPLHNMGHEQLISWVQEKINGCTSNTKKKEKVVWEKTLQCLKAEKKKGKVIDGNLLIQSAGEGIQKLRAIGFKSGFNNNKRTLLQELVEGLKEKPESTPMSLTHDGRSPANSLNTQNGRSPANSLNRKRTLTGGSISRSAGGAGKHQGVGGAQRSKTVTPMNTEANQTPASAQPTTGIDLPKGWVEITDPSSGKPYYHNKKKGETTWTRPTTCRRLASRRLAS